MQPLAAAIDIDFISHRDVADLRAMLLIATGQQLGGTVVYFKVWQVHRRMPLPLGFVLVEGVIGLAENTGTATRLWIHPGQAAGWSPVSAAKRGSSFLSMIVFYVLVRLLSRPEPMPEAVPASRPCGGPRASDPAPGPVDQLT